jgi:aryl-alcohol dehydrogenase (NADP+)
MQYRRLGDTGMQVSRLCLGCMSYGSPNWRNWVLGEKESRPFFEAALELGITFFDTADVYSHGASEEVVGRILKDLARREDVVIASKVYNPMGEGPNDRGLSRKHIMHAIDGTLSRLGVDFVDLYIIHRWDAETPIEETMGALNDVVAAGKALYIGASSMYTWQFAKAQAVAERNGWTKFVSMQNHYNLVYREEEREMIPLCRDSGVALTPWSPLARGFLAGNRQRGGGGATTRSTGDPMAARMYYNEADFEIVARVQQVAAARGAKPMQVALAWLLRKPEITAPIIGVTRLEQLPELSGALDVTLSDEEVETLEAPYRPKPIAGHR